MKRFYERILATAVLAAMALSIAVHPAASQTIVARIDASKTSVPVSKDVFGMFIEHIGKTMYGPLWAEMLDDRKFYFPILAVDPPEDPNVPDFVRKLQPRRWHPVGPAEAVTMDKVKPFVGEQSPSIALDPATPHGFRQTGIALVKGKRYVGRIIARGDGNAQLKVTLEWGPGNNEKQVITVPVAESYKAVPLTFLAQADSTDAAFAITATGKGTVHVGAVSLMPADNIHGYRPDTIALIRKINSGFWRFGGNYTSNYTWYNAIGDPDKRPPEWDHAWNTMQTNDLGMDEFAELCKLIGVEPYISVNAGLGDAHSAAEQVEYMNGPVTTHMGALRAKNGHPAPYNVRYWNIGNEPWGPWQIGRTDTKYFMQKHNDFARAMRAVDPSIILIASGEFLEDGSVPGPLRAKNIGNLEPIYSTDADWTGSFLKNCWGNFDGIAEHWYASPGVRFDPEKAKTLPPEANSDQANIKVTQTLQEFARYPANIVRVKAEGWQGYQQRFPAMLQKKTFLSIDEYAYFGGDFGKSPSWKQALAYGMIFNEMLRHTDSITMGAHTMGTSTIDANQTASTMNTIGLVFQMYSHSFPGTTPVAIDGNAPQPAPKYPPTGDQPKTSSGSPTYPLDVFAAISKDGKSLIVSIVNATESAQNLDLQISGVKTNGPASLWSLVGPSLESSNRVGHPAEVELKTSQHTAPSTAITAPPISIGIYRFALTQ